MRNLITVLFSLVLLVLIVAGVGIVYVYSGAYNVAATDDHLDLVQSALRTTKAQSIRAHAEDVSIAVPSDSAALRRAYRSYEEMCVVCHGAPGKERGWMGKGMNPEPPDLAESAEEFSVEEIYWVLRNGLKMAGMPALQPTHDDAVILELTAFVESLARMTEQEYAALGPVEQDTTATDGHAGHVH